MRDLSFDHANAFHRMMRSFAATKVGSAVLRPTAHHLDRLITRVTGGRSSFAGIATGVPVVMLTTTGAKSGEPRTVAVYGIPHPDGVALIASNFGGATHPAWYHNLKAHPDITVEVGSETFRAHAEELAGAARARLWSTLIAAWPDLAAFDSKTERPIPLLLLRRIAP
jgi:deazaflavin-dependent oxidoreductase (nitroreductase family)